LSSSSSPSQCQAGTNNLRVGYQGCSVRLRNLSLEIISKYLTWHHSSKITGTSLFRLGWSLAFQSSVASIWTLSFDKV
jgi:hypothetical protein